MLELLDAERFETGRADDRDRVFDQQVHLVGRLIDREHQDARRGGKRVPIAELLRGAGRNRRKHDHAVVTELDGVARDVTLPGTKLARAGRHAARPGGSERIGGHPRRDAGVLELQNLEHLARAVLVGPRHGREPSRQVNRHARARGWKRDEILDVDGGPADDVQRQREIGDAVKPHADRVSAGAVRAAERYAIAPSRVAAHRIERTGSLARQAMQNHPRVAERHGIATAPQHAPADAHHLREERRGDAYQQQQATA